jgi:hypothetical protein
MTLVTQAFFQGCIEVLVDIGTSGIFIARLPLPV